MLPPAPVGTRRIVRALATALVAISVLSAGPAATGAQTYRQPVWFQWVRADLDTIIIPPNHGQIVNGNGLLAGGDPFELHPLENSYLRAIEDSILDWNRSVRRWGPSWLRENFNNDVYVLGRDEIPPEVLQSPEIIVLTDLTKANILGFALTVTSSRCIVDNSKFFVESVTDVDMYNINAQEYGHCLGLMHVNEASPPNPNNDDIRHDPMNGSYPHQPGASGTELHCISNLNIKGLEEVFRRAILGTPGARNGEIDGAAYVRPASCP